MVVLQIISKVARSGCHFILEMMSYVVQLALLGSQDHISPQTQKLLSDLPVNPKMAAKQCHLDRKNTIYATCPNPSCHQTYKSIYHDGCSIAEYPRHCTHKQFANGPSCGTGLTRPRIIEDIEILTPIKPFLSFGFKDWLAGLVSCPGYEDLMNSAWKKTNVDLANGISDITEANFLHNFIGPNGERLFKDSRSEGQYAFSLCVDFFTPLLNKQAGKKVSIRIISLACLNLLLDECYKPENMFLIGIIPGPKEPPLNLLNHYLTPIVDDLLEFWSPGIQFSCMYNHPTG